MDNARAGRGSSGVTWKGRFFAALFLRRSYVGLAEDRCCPLRRGCRHWFGVRLVGVHVQDGRVHAFLRHFVRHRPPRHPHREHLEERLEALVFLQGRKASLRGFLVGLVGVHVQDGGVYAVPLQFVLHRLPRHPHREHLEERLEALVLLQGSTACSLLSFALVSGKGKIQKVSDRRVPLFPHISLLRISLLRISGQRFRRIFVAKKCGEVSPVPLCPPRFPLRQRRIRLSTRAWRPAGRGFWPRRFCLLPGRTRPIPGRERSRSSSNPWGRPTLRRAPRLQVSALREPALRWELVASTLIWPSSPILARTPPEAPRRLGPRASPRRASPKSQRVPSTTVSAESRSRGRLSIGRRGRGTACRSSLFGSNRSPARRARSPGRRTAPPWRTSPFVPAWYRPGGYSSFSSHHGLSPKRRSFPGAHEWSQNGCPHRPKRLSPPLPRRRTRPSLFPPAGPRMPPGVLGPSTSRPRTFPPSCERTPCRPPSACLQCPGL